MDDTNINLADFKLRLIQGLLGNRHEAIARAPKSPTKENIHKPGTVAGQYRCAYCALFNNLHRTSFKCTMHSSGMWHTIVFRDMGNMIEIVSILFIVN